MTGSAGLLLLLLAASRSVAVIAAVPNKDNVVDLKRPFSSRQRRQKGLLSGGVGSRGVPRAGLFWSGGVEPTTTPSSTSSLSSDDEKEEDGVKRQTLALTPSRGGGTTTTNKAAVVHNDPPTLSQALAGTVAFAVIEYLVKRSLVVAQVKYPAGLGACILLFTILCLTDAVAPTVAHSVYAALSPGAALLAQWFPVFFVPGLALLPLSPSIGGTVDVSTG